MKNLGTAIQRNSDKIKKMGRTMTVAGAAIVGGIALMVKAYASFDEAMVKSLAIMGDISPAMRKEMAKTAKQLSTESTFAAKSLAEAYYFLASAGMDAEQSIAALGPVAKFAQAGAFDLAQATDLLTDAQTALNLSSKDAVKNQENLIRVSDVLVGANTLANASVLQFSEALTNKAAASLVNLNKEVEEGVAVLAAYADKGVKGQIAGQRLTMMLNGLFDAVRNNSKAWKDIGIGLFEADGSMRSIADIIGDMEVALGDMTVKEREATLAMLGFNIRTKDSILTLMGSSEKIRKWTEDLKKMSGITEEVADKQMEAFNARMTVLKNTIIKGAIAIGQSLAPMILSLTEKVKNVSAKIAEWIEKHPKLTAVIMKVAAAIGGLLAVLGPMMMMLPGIIAALPALKLALASLLGPLGAIIVAATAAGVAINALIENYKKQQDAEIQAILKASTAHAKYHAMRKFMINEEIVSVQEWSEIFNKHGRNYKRVLHAISTLPEYEHIRKALEGIKKKEEEVKEATIELAATATKVMPSWATTVGKIFHDTSVRVADIKREMRDTKLIMPGIAVNIPKMSLKDFEEFHKEWLANLQEKWEQQWADRVMWAQYFTNQLAGIFNQLTQNQMMNIDKEYEARKAAIESSLMTEKSKYDAMEKLDKEFEKKRKKAARTQAKRTKVIGIMESLINTSVGITKALSTANIPLAIAIGIMGAVQTALIAATPLPTLAKGGRLGRGEPGIVGEEGAELFVPDAAGTVVPLRERAGGIGANITIFTEIRMQTIDAITTREFMRREGLQAIVEAIKIGIMKPEIQTALGIK